MNLLILSLIRKFETVTLVTVSICFQQENLPVKTILFNPTLINDLTLERKIDTKNPIT